MFTIYTRYIESKFTSRNITKSIILAIASLLVASASLIACTQKGVQGVWFTQSQVQKLQVGQQNKTQILELLGAPNLLNPYRTNIFYYYGAHAKQTGKFSPKLKKPQILILLFDEKTEILKALELRDISKVKYSKVDSSKTKGLRSGKRNLLDDIFGNIGQVGVGGS